MITTILEIISGILKAIPIVSRWFTKTPTEKIDDKKKDLDEKMDKYRRTGRPDWD